MDSSGQTCGSAVVQGDGRQPGLMAVQGSALKMLARDRLSKPMESAVSGLETSSHEQHRSVWVNFAHILHLIQSSCHHFASKIFTNRFFTATQPTGLTHCFDSPTRFTSTCFQMSRIHVSPRPASPQWSEDAALQAVRRLVRERMDVACTAPFLLASFHNNGTLFAEGHAEQRSRGFLVATMTSCLEVLYSNRKRL